MLTTFESTVRQIMAPQQRVYDMLSNLENIEKVRDRLPADKIESLSFDRDSVSISVPPVGAVTMKVVDREEPKTIKFEAANSPVPFNLWIQLVPVTDDSCKMKLTIKAELNIFIKGMVQKPLQEGLERMADVLQNIPY
ncbi:MAG: SRPBCC family protein [Prevotella sp.]|nr:SRPBCC family protein [Prevotella sp.]MBQ9532941.1 SRPBCC family protein [Prevotella sp.]